MITKVIRGHQVSFSFGLTQIGCDSLPRSAWRLRKHDCFLGLTTFIFSKCLAGGYMVLDLRCHPGQEYTFTRSFQTPRNILLPFSYLSSRSYFCRRTIMPCKRLGAHCNGFLIIESSGFWSLKTTVFLPNV